MPATSGASGPGTTKLIRSATANATRARITITGIRQPRQFLAQPRRMERQLVAAQSGGAQRVARAPQADRLRAAAARAHRAARRAQRAGGRLIGNLPARRFGNPGPVLAPQRAVANQPPGQRRAHQPRSGAGREFQKISSYGSHGSFSITLICGSPGRHSAVRRARDNRCNCPCASRHGPAGPSHSGCSR